MKETTQERLAAVVGKTITAIRPVTPGLRALAPLLFGKLPEGAYVIELSGCEQLYVSGLHFVDAVEINNDKTVTAK